MTDRTCNKCAETKASSLFPVLQSGKRVNTCKACRVAANSRRWREDPGGKLRAYQAAYREQRRELLSAKEKERRARNWPGILDTQQARKFGLTVEQYRGMFEAQGHRCAICGKEETGRKRLSVDHCHATGRVRALLCRACNTLLGNADDSVERLRACITYLETYR